MNNIRCLHSNWVYIESVSLLLLKEAYACHDCGSLIIMIDGEWTVISTEEFSEMVSEALENWESRDKPRE